MQISLNQIAFEQNRSFIAKNLEAYGESIDSYYEDHIIESIHYQIDIDGLYAGYISIFENNMVTQFFLIDDYLNWASDVFAYIMNSISINSIYVSTCDKLLLITALEYSKRIEIQDYIFHVVKTISLNNHFNIRKANNSDITGILNSHDGFFKNLEQNVHNGELFIGIYENNIVSYGIIEKSKIFHELASLGMFVIKNERGKGFGSKTVVGLIHYCKDNKIQPIAGCFSKNKYSVNALKNAGMCSTNRLLKVDI